MNIWLDDIRPAPSGWVHCFKAAEVIALYNLSLENEQRINIISLDHDLGDAENGTGYDVLLYIEEKVFGGALPPQAIKIHSANPVGRKKMEQAISSIYGIVTQLVE